MKGVLGIISLNKGEISQINLYLNLIYKTFFFAYTGRV